MSNYDNTNRGSIWKNPKKTTDKHPDFTGTLNVEGTEYWVSAWKRKEGQSDKAPALSFQIKMKEEVHGLPPEKEVRGPVSKMSDDIPF